MIQFNLFDFAEPEPVDTPPVPRQPPAKKPPKQKKRVYRCKCGRSITLYVKAIHILCGCGRVMRED